MRLYNKVSICNLYMLILLDVLMLPFMPGIKIPFGSLFLALIFLFKKKEICRLNICFFIFILAILLSLAYSYFFHPNFLREAINNSFILLIAISYLHAFSKNKSDLRRYMYKLLQLYLCFNFIMALIYYYDYQSYFYLRSFFTFSGKTLTYTAFDITSRFGCIMSDANNEACAIVAVLALLTEIEQNRIFKFMYYVMSCVIVVATMSVTGLFAMLFMIGFNIIKSNLIDLKKTVLFTISILVLSVFLYYIISDTQVGQGYLERISINFSDSTGGGRTKIWESTINDFNLYNRLLFGDGGVLVLNNNSHSPHNGHLYLIYGYGLLSYFVFIFAFFKYVKHFNCAWVFMINFTLNTVLQDYRATMLYMILMIYDLMRRQTD